MILQHLPGTGMCCTGKDHMDFCRTTYHVVQQGDSFYRLAQQYQTTVPDIISHNPGINPYNLQVGTRLNICSGSENDTLQQEEMELNSDMRHAWSQHGLWTAMLLPSIFYKLPNQEAVQNRLMQTPEDITSVFEKFYAQPMTNQLRQLLTEHTQIGGELMTALRDNDMDKANQLEAQWYQNADKIARMLSNANGKYSYEELRGMLRTHLDMLKDAMMAELSKEYGETVQMLDENDAHLMEIADALTNGIVEQFYRR